MHALGKEKKRPCGPAVLLKLSFKFPLIFIYPISWQEGGINSFSQVSYHSSNGMNVWHIKGHIYIKAGICHTVFSE